MFNDLKISGIALKDKANLIAQLEMNALLLEYLDLFSVPV